MKKYSNQTAFHILMFLVMVSFFISCGSSGKDVKNENRFSGIATKSNQIIANTYTINKSDDKENKGKVIKSASIDNKLKRSVSATNQTFSEKTVSQGSKGNNGNYHSHYSRVSPQRNVSENVSVINTQKVTPNSQSYSPERKVNATVQNASVMNTQTTGSVLQKGKPNGPGVEGNLPVGDGLVILLLMAVSYSMRKYILFK